MTTAEELHGDPHVERYLETDRVIPVVVLERD
jgi:hypothetical protein